MRSKTTKKPMKLGAGSIHTSRTLMLSDLQTALIHSSEEGALAKDLRKAVVDDNILGKKTERTRLRSWRYLCSTYQLADPDLAATGFLQLWHQASEAQGQLALIKVISSDKLLQVSAEWVKALSLGQEASWPELAAFLRIQGVAYSDKTIGSISRNLLSSWSQAGWLSGKVAKKRAAVVWQPAAVTYLLFQEYRRGGRGLGLYDSESAKLLGLTPEQLDVLASEASRRGLLNYRRLDDVLEITFPHFAGPE